MINDFIKITKMYINFDFMEVESRTAIMRSQEQQGWIEKAERDWINAADYRLKEGMMSGVLQRHNMPTVYSTLLATL